MSLLPDAGAARPPDLSPKPPLEPQALIHLARSSGDVFERCVSQALQTTRATTVMAFVHRPLQDVLEVVAAAGHLANDVLNRKLRRGEALAWLVYSSGEELLLAEPHKHQEAHFVSGKRRPGMYLGVPLIDPDGQVFGVLSADTTDSAEVLAADDARALHLLGQAVGAAYSRLLALEQAQLTAQRYEQLARLSADLELLQDPGEIARHALGTLLDISGFSVGGLFEVLPDGQAALHLLMGQAASAELDVAWLRVPHAPLGIIQRVIEQRAALVMPGAQNPVNTPLERHSLIRTALAAPLMAQGEVVGVIGLAQFHTQQEVSPELLKLLEMVALRIDRAVERSSGVERLRLLREAALRSVGRVLEYRDDETFGHTDRVTTLALRLGEALGLSADALQHLRWGAYLHDIGKVAVSDAILRKPGPLTPSERLEMQRHVVTGDDLLLDELFVPREVREVVRHHHERWDGAGYPDGLAGHDIPLLARIFSVVDVYDALTSERPYKRAWTSEAALAELSRCAGTQFDADVVATFLTLL
ncbi:HD domain-containing phosphohydrolase [Deinococcus ruber]|uniref:HD-GYP domain-containing protein n=1 Tax=Deinococcus ruber TaxID=1848197 RepID=A0A918FBB7_9DEIO|nr:HD domain-containing phosphohydrolase [Deinococcus ruber]GGR18681.1 hypothetical protein GCM10008957_34130 [Deinococcus ruber]